MLSVVEVVVDVEEGVEEEELAVVEVVVDVERRRGGSRC